MTTKMTRRTFLKGAAAAAAAVSLSGLLTGCGGDQLADNEVQIGPFIVKVYGLDVNLGTASGNDKGAITGKVKLRYDAGGSSWQGGSYNNMFKAVVVDANLTQVAPTGPFFVSDALVGKPFAPGTLERVPGAFCRSAQGQKDGFGQFFRQCKERCYGFHRQFTSSLQRPGPAPKRFTCILPCHGRRNAAGGIQ